jgi:hypothetical protein
MLISHTSAPSIASVKRWSISRYILHLLLRISRLFTLQAIDGVKGFQTDERLVMDMASRDEQLVLIIVLACRPSSSAEGNRCCTLSTAYRVTCNNDPSTWPPYTILHPFQSNCIAGRVSLIHEGEGIETWWVDRISSGYRVWMDLFNRIIAAIRFFKAFVKTRNSFLYRHLTKNDLVLPLIEMLEVEAPRDNMLCSSCLDLFETIRKVSLSQLWSYIEMMIEVLAETRKTSSLSSTIYSRNTMPACRD